MEREKYESLSLAALRDIAKARGLKNVSTMKKSMLIDSMMILFWSVFKLFNGFV